MVKRALDPTHTRYRAQDHSPGPFFLVALVAIGCDAITLEDILIPWNKKFIFVINYPNTPNLFLRGKRII